MSHTTSMESVTSLVSQTRLYCSNSNTESQVTVARRPLPPSYPSIDSVLKASVPSPTTPPDSTWTLGSAYNSTVDLDQPSPADPEHHESTSQERPISYLAPLPTFPTVKRCRHVRNLNLHILTKIKPSTSAIPSHPLSPLNNFDQTWQHKGAHPRNPADSRRDDQRPPIPERESSLDFQRRQQEQELEKMYLNIHPSLPANAPAKHPHIIDSAKVSCPPPHGIGFADMVVTILHTHGPATLTSFLDLHNPKFKFWYTRGVLKRFYIERSKQFVTTGFVQAGNKKKLEEGLTYRILEESEGAWEPLCAMGSVNGLFLGPREIDAYARKVFVVRLMKEMGWIKKAGSGSKFVEGEM